MTLRIRPATPSDAALLAGLGARTFRDAFGAQNDPADLAAFLATEFSLERQAADLAQTEWTTLLAEVDGLAVGYAQSLPREVPVPLDPGPVRYLRRLYLEQAWTGRGVGRPLLSAIAADARDRGVATLWLNTWERATHAIAFYRKQGFAEVGTMTFMVGNDPQRDLVFALRL
ncbi:MAG: GNAT family N-acetyltransferase [Gemmatimonadetes bacterium]|nr:GNAT family N-acetyltransferase [Gemmatimonadota bacterium]MBK7783037.1 GNAT family N-acetyltransferase [Gemmatimonadota bacterium]MBK9068913.1 GNAT family N-acetyltransferase [Gemmatimonadota bacterium]